MNTPLLGPAVTATIMSRNYRASVDAWCDFLHHHVHSEVTISEKGASNWGVAELAGHRVTWLANELNEAWLRIVEAPNAIKRQSFDTYGWMALEIGVEDVTELHESLIDSPFKIITESGPTGSADDENSIQAVGLDGEVLRLTQLASAIEPFEIPSARCTVDRLFNAVAAVPNCARALDFYNDLSPLTWQHFDKKRLIPNDRPKPASDQTHRVAAAQLSGQTVLELGEIHDLKSAPDNSAPFTGIVAISFEIASLPNNANYYEIIQGPHRGRTGCVKIGAAGEFMELIERMK